MRHKHGGVAVFFTRPAEKQRPIGEFIIFASFKNVGVKCGEKVFKFLKFGFILQRFIVVGHGFTFYKAGGTESVYNDDPEVKNLHIGCNSLSITSLPIFAIKKDW